MVKLCAWGTCNSDTQGWATVCVFTLSQATSQPR